MSAIRRRKFWGWGWQDESVEPALLGAIESALASLIGMNEIRRREPPRIEELEIAAPRVQAPQSLAALLGDSREERAAHCYGKSYRDLVRAICGDFAHAPDLVAYPESEADVITLLDFCASARLAAIPYGGGSSVCGGVEPAIGDAFAGALSIDMRRMRRVLEIDRASRAARIQAGIYGPELEAELRPHGLSLRHYPQSFEFSTLGGWIATRSGGHFTTLFTHVDELVEALTIVTPTGSIATRRLPGDGAGPSPERLFIGSEGIFGVITEAWMRLFERPRFRASATASFVDFPSGCRAVKMLAQSGLYPSNARLIDGMEALMNGAGTGERAILLVAFESHDHPLDAWIGRAVEICRASGGDVPDGSIRTRVESDERDAAAGAWRSAFLRAPYLRDELVLRGVFVETFETAVTWDRLIGLHSAVSEAATRTARHTSGGNAIVTCRLTHAYPDGAAPYFTVICPARAGAELEQWAEIKAAITDAMLAHGGTVTHHHAVGRDFRPFYDRQRPSGFARALVACKRSLDPNGMMNPGVLVDARATEGESS